MSDFFGKIKSGAGKVAFEADKMTRVNKAKGELEHLKRQEEESYAKIGQLYVSQRTSLTFTGPAFDELCTAIDSFEQQIQAKNDEIQRIGAETYAAPQPTPTPAPTYTAMPTPTNVTPAAPIPTPDAAPATKFCPNCGKEVGAAVKFCPDCGSKL